MNAQNAAAGARGRVVWLTGLPGAGKTTLAVAVERVLRDRGEPVFRLDGDELRRGLCAGLGFSAADRAENIRRAAEAARLLADAGLTCIVALISPLRVDRARARAIISSDRFLEVHVATPLEVCRRRDPKGLYARAERGEIAEFTGVSSPYETPEAPEIRVPAGQDSVDACVAQIIAHLEKRRR
ncbi:MAG TPA: adenylyl-sulfate kinase [Lacunisphaera sp.]|jgi:adenylyl-sulfate kinase|nr:adenylyl-sulfate kinase [Lacunisphaera sp.]